MTISCALFTFAERIKKSRLPNKVGGYKIQKDNQVKHMGYYVGNGVYNYLAQCGEKENFFWTSGDMWLLVYGNESFEPKILTVASARALGEAITEQEHRAVSMAQSLAENTGMPVNFIRFDPNGSMESVTYWEQGMNKIQVISPDGLRNRLIRHGLRMNPSQAAKAINDKSSSPYHEWQRAHMGNSVIVADIDLIRLREGSPTEMIELKRSYIALEAWEPYKQDYKNFLLLSTLAKKRRLGFYIVYNHRTKNPFYDDVSRLKIFSFDHTREPYCSLLGYQSVQQFAQNYVNSDTNEQVN